MPVINALVKGEKEIRVRFLEHHVHTKADAFVLTAQNARGTKMLFTSDTMKRRRDVNDEAMDRFMQRHGDSLASDIVKYLYHGMLRNEACPAAQQRSCSLGGFKQRRRDDYTHPRRYQKIRRKTSWRTICSTSNTPAAIFCA